MTYHARSTWVHPAPPIIGPKMPPWADIDTIVLHHPAGNTPDGDPADTTVDRFLRSIQIAWERDRDYSIGYSFGFDAWGDVWELRGWDIKPAATLGHNGHTLAFLLIVDEGAECTEAQLESVRAYVLEAERRRGAPMRIAGHHEFAATACPGAGVRRQLAAGLFRPQAPAPTPTPPTEVPDMLTARRVRLRGTLNVFLIGAGPPIHLTPELDKTLEAVPLVTVAHHPQFAANLYAQTGLKPTDLVGTWT